MFYQGNVKAFTKGKSKVLPRESPSFYQGKYLRFYQEKIQGFTKGKSKDLPRENQSFYQGKIQGFT